MSKPVWLVLATKLVDQAVRDANRKRAKELREKKARAAFALEARARLKTEKPHLYPVVHHAPN